MLVPLLMAPYDPVSAQAHWAGPITMDKCLFSPGLMHLRHAFYPNGTVVVSNELGATLVIEGLELPFAHDTELKDYGNGTIAYRLHFRCLGMTYEVWEIFDFGARPDAVKITIWGALPTPGRIAISLRAGAGSLAQCDNLSKIFWCAESGNGSVGFDWNDMASIATFSPSTNTITAVVSGQFLIDPSTVGTSSATYATSDPFQRKTFYANGRYWVFYSDGTNMVYCTSTDATTWTAPTTARASCSSGRLFAIWFDGTYLHYAYATGTSNAALNYRRGTPNSDGSITWSAVEQTAVGAVFGITYNYPMISVDSQGYAWIAYRRTGANTYPYVTKSGNNDGTWGSTPSGFPYQLSTTSANVMTEIIPLTSQKMLAIYAVSSNTIKSQRWDGSSTWGAEVATTSAIHLDWAFSAVAQGDDVHLVFLKSTSYDIVHTIYTYNSWGTETTVQASTTSSSGPALSLDASNNILYCFWAGSPTVNHIYYKKYTTSWSAYTDWISDTLTGNRQLTSFYQSYGYMIGLAYVTNTLSPYNVRFAAVGPVVPEYPYGPLFTLFLGLCIYLLVVHRHPSSSFTNEHL